MAIPASPLVVKQFDVNNLTLDEWELFEAGGFTASGFKRFLLEHSNWNKAEIGKITIGELKDVADQLGKAINEAIVPKGKAPASESGQG